MFFSGLSWWFQLEVGKEKRSHYFPSHAQWQAGPSDVSIQIWLLPFAAPASNQRLLSNLAPPPQGPTQFWSLWSLVSISCPDHCSHHHPSPRSGKPSSVQSSPGLLLQGE